MSSCEESNSFVWGTVLFPGTKEELEHILRRSGISATVGMWALRLFEPLWRFEIAYVGNITPEEPFQIEVDGYSIPIETVADWCERLAICLRSNGIRFEMTHFTAEGEEIHVYKA